MTDRRSFSSGGQQPGFFPKTVRGILRKNLVSDDPLVWPMFGRFDILGPGRLFVLTATTSSTLVVTGNVTDYVAAGDSLRVFNAGGANGRYTVVSASYSTPSTTITVSETVPASTITADSAVDQTEIRPDHRLVYAIQSQTSGAAGNVVITSPASTLVAEDPICECDLFLEDYKVEIQGSEDGVNDKIYRCRQDFTDASGLRTVYLEGLVTDIPSGSLGNLIHHWPLPLRIQRSGLAVLRWYRVSLLENCIIHCLPLDGDDWYEIIAADIGPSDEPEPE